MEPPTSPLSLRSSPGIQGWDPSGWARSTSSTSSTGHGSTGQLGDRSPDLLEVAGAAQAGDLYLRLGVPAGPGCLHEQTNEPLHSAVDSDMVGLDWSPLTVSAQSEPSNRKIGKPCSGRG